MNPHLVRIKTGVGAIVLASTVATALWIFWPVSVPTFDAVREAYRPSEAYLLDRHGVALDSRRLRFDVQRLPWTPLSDLSPALVAALVKGEDRRFWLHHGVDWIGAAGAVRDNLLHGKRRGASTITMQLARLLDGRLASQVGTSWWEKCRQARTALAMERRWTKAQILEAYVNLLGYRNELQGIAAASRRLFGKIPSGLSTPESLVLAALLPNPGARIERVVARACVRISQTPAEADCEAIRAAASTMGRVNVAVDDDHLAPQLAQRLLHDPGELVRTTIDARLQRLARDAVRNHLDSLVNHNVRDGAALIVDNQTGEVLAYVASAGNASRARAVDGVMALRQAGSTLKPFLYELALERRYITAASLLQDSPLSLETASGVYLPQDYEHDFKGLVSVRTALAGSLNIPAVRTLVLVGIDSFRDRLLQLGYQDIKRDSQFYGYSLALGSAEVSLWQQAQAYRTLARSGEWSPISVTASGNSGRNHYLMPKESSFIVNDILADPAARAVTFGLDNHLKTPYWTAAKTGTSEDMRDNWCIGYSSRYTVAVWVGNFEGDSMLDVSGVTGAAPIWHDLMLALGDGGSGNPPRAPDSLTVHRVTFQPAIEPPRNEWFLTDTTHRADTITTISGAMRPGITSPANGIVVALDPDIPPDRQRVLFSAKGASRGQSFALNSVVYGPATATTMWTPKPGTYYLSLLDAQGQQLDRVLFTVRGAPM